MKILIAIFASVTLLSLLVFSPRIEIRYCEKKRKETIIALLAAAGIVIVTILWVFFDNCTVPYRIILVTGLFFFTNTLFNNAKWAFTPNRYFISTKTSNPNKNDGLRGFLYSKNIVLAKENGKAIEWVTNNQTYKNIEQAQDALFMTAYIIGKSQGQNSDIVWIDNDDFTFYKNNWLKYGAGWFKGIGLYNLNTKEAIFKKGDNSFSYDEYTFSIKSI